MFISAWGDVSACYVMQQMAACAFRCHDTNYVLALRLTLYVVSFVFSCFSDCIGSRLGLLLFTSPFTCILVCDACIIRMEDPTVGEAGG